MPYKPSLVSFFDILGFRSLVKTAEPEAIDNILRKLRRHSTPDKDSAEMFEMETIAFSDSIVRSVNILSETNVEHATGIVWHELYAIACVQGSLVYEDGVFLRGAITADDLHIGDGIVFGPGLVRAYELESEHARFPRILVDDNLIDLFKEYQPLLGADHHDLETDLAYIDGLTDIDTDGCRFIDYLVAAHNDVDGDMGFLDMLERHFERVREKAQQHAGHPSVMEKYLWAASYHNRVVNGCDESFFEVYETSKSAYILTDKHVPGLSSWKPPEPRKA